MTSTHCIVGEFAACFCGMLHYLRKGGSVVVTYWRENRPVAVFQPPSAKPKRKLGPLTDKLKVIIGPD